jgi:hypothetical protein
VRVVDPFAVRKRAAVVPVKDHRNGPGSHDVLAQFLDKAVRQVLVLGRRVSLVVD